MQQIAEYGLWALLGALAYAGAHVSIVEYRESKRLARESMRRHPVNDYGRLDHLDGLVRDGVVHMERDEALRARVEGEQW
jgi:hypothetical protein